MRSIFFIIIFLIIFLVYRNVNSYITEKVSLLYRSMHNNSRVVQPVIYTINDTIILEEIIKQKIKYPKIVLAQARLESGNFKSALFYKTNNLFGMGFPYRRVTTSIGNYKGMSLYNNWIDSVRDYKIWQNRFFKGKTREDYYCLLQRVYSEDSCYIDKIKMIIGEYD